MKNKKILIGVTAGIAIYKICSLIRMFIKNGAEVRVIMTDSSTKLISPVVFQSLSGNAVYVDMYKPIKENAVDHINLANWCDIFVLAPASANTIGKIANGIADNLLTTTVMALPKNKPIIVAPAMNTNMWENEFFKKNMEIIKKANNYHIIDPETGLLAEGSRGKGVLADINKIFDKSKEVLS
jgi:phosphopantothenoylcysteine decarboxylase / phosphopantothenate---cysteine ligase